MAWADACCPRTAEQASLKVTSIEHLGSGVALLQIAKEFLPAPEGQPDVGSEILGPAERRELAAKHVQEVASLQIDMDLVRAGDHTVLRDLLGAMLFATSRGPFFHAVMPFIEKLDMAHQHVLATVLQTYGAGVVGEAVEGAVQKRQSEEFQASLDSIRAGAATKMLGMMTTKLSGSLDRPFTAEQEQRLLGITRLLQPRGTLSSHTTSCRVRGAWRMAARELLDPQRVETVTREIQEMQAELFESEEECDKTNHIVNTEQSELQDTHHRIQMEENAMLERDQQRQEMQEEHSRAKEGCVFLEKELEVEEQAAKERSKPVRFLRENLEVQQRANLQLNMKAQELEMHIELVTKSLAFRDGGLKNSLLRSKLTKLEEELGSNYQKLGAVRGHDRHELATSKSLMRQLEETAEELTFREQEASDQRGHVVFAEQTLGRLESELASVNRKLRVHLQGDMQALRAELRAEQHQMAELEQQVEECKHKKEQYEEALPKLKETSETRIRELEAARKEELSLHEELQKDVAAAEGIRQELADSRQELEEVSANARRLREEAGNASRERASEMEAMISAEALGAELLVEAEAGLQRDEAAAAELRTASNAGESSMDDGNSSRDELVAEQISSLQEQVVLREREISFREEIAGQRETHHEREMRSLASAMHRLGQRYGRLVRAYEGIERRHEVVERSWARARGAFGPKK